MSTTCQGGSPGKSSPSEVSRQITEESTRLVLGERRAVEAQIPKIDIGQVLDLHTKRRWSSQYSESVSTTQGYHRPRWTLRSVIDAGRIRSKMQDRDVGGKGRLSRNLVAGVERRRKAGLVQGGGTDTFSLEVRPQHLHFA